MAGIGAALTRPSGVSPSGKGANGAKRLAEFRIKARLAGRKTQGCQVCQVCVPPLGTLDYPDVRQGNRQDAKSAEDAERTG